LGISCHLIRWHSVVSEFHKWQNAPVADLNSIRIFVTVAQFESITGAARSLGMPPSTVSRRLSALESELGVSLLRRSTRRVSLTAQGRAYFGQCQEPLNLLQEAEQVLTQSQKKPEGLLRITVPVIFGREPFLDFVSAFQKEHPAIRIDLFISNVFVDLIADNFDVAIRFGDLQDSNIVAKRLGKSVRYVVAAPEYLQGRPLPEEPSDLEAHDCVLLNAKNGESDWELVSGRKKVSVRVSGPISSRDFDSVSGFVRRAHGVGLLPSTYCDEPIAKGRLVRLLPQWGSPPISLFAVYPSRKFLPLRLSVFLEALAGWDSPLWIKD
jgi:DNA-binding transcriptional LysR family regulator